MYFCTHAKLIFGTSENTFVKKCLVASHQPNSNGRGLDIINIRSTATCYSRRFDLRGTLAATNSCQSIPVLLGRPCVCSTLQ